MSSKKAVTTTSCPDIDPVMKLIQSCRDAIVPAIVLVCCGARNLLRDDKKTKRRKRHKATARTAKDSDKEVRKTVKAEQKENGEALGRTHDPRSLHGPTMALPPTRQTAAIPHSA